MKFAVFFLLGTLLSSSISIASVPPRPNQQLSQVHSLSFSFNTPVFVDDGSTLRVLMEGAPACRYVSGQPVLPMVTRTIQLPFGSVIKDVVIDVGVLSTMGVQKKITTAPCPLTRVTSHEQYKGMCYAEALYSLDFHPPRWFDYFTGGGINEEGIRVTFFTVLVFPVRYNNAADIILYLDACDFIVTYDLPMSSPFPSEATNDLLIICPDLFVPALQPLVAHKNMFGLRTQIKTVQAIYRDYEGYDRPEQIKYFIKDAVERWGTTYVLIIGGLTSHLMGTPRDNRNTGTDDWYVPVRYTNIWDDDSIFDPGFISDLYYADIYDGQGLFCNWNSFDDGVYGGWSHKACLGSPGSSNDEIDFYPDIYLGRLPCRNILEVHIIVKKIIAYETTPADPSWFKRMVVVGGDPYDDEGTDFLEGELIGEKALSYMYGFEHCRLFSSNRYINPAFTPKTRNIIREINQGCGFLFFDGHGGPWWWNTFWPGDFAVLIPNGGMNALDIQRIRNEEKLPVCVVGGCHNNLFNVSCFSTVTDPRNKRSMWSYGVPIAECWGESLVFHPRGGAIACLGNTGLGYEAGGEIGDLDGDGVNEPDCVEALCGYLETQFFKGYSVNHIDRLGNIWCRAIVQYLQIYPGMGQWSDAKTLEQWVLFGDPTLKIGGYVR